MSIYHDWVMYGKLFEAAIFAEIWMNQTGAVFW